MAVHTEAMDWLSYSVEVAAAVAALHGKQPLDLVDFPEWGAEGYAHLLNRTEWNRIPTVIHLHGPLVMFAHTMDWPAMDSEFYRVGAVMEGTHQKHRRRRHALAVCLGADIGRDRHLADVEFEPAHHAAERIDQRIDLDEVELEAMGGFTNKTIRATYYITEDSLWRLKQFLEHCGIEESGSLRQMIDETPNAEVIAFMRHEASQDGEAVFATLAKTAPVE